MQKLTNMEAQRVINCIDDALSRLSIMASVPAANPDPDLLQALEEDGNVPLRAAVEEQWGSEEAYLMARAQAVTHSSHGHRHHQHHHHGHHSQSSAPPQVSPEVSARVHESVRTVCRLARRSPVALERLTGRNSHELRPQSHGSPEFAALHDTLADLTRATFQKLATTVEEEASSKALMHELVERERGAEDERNALSATLGVQREERAREAAAVGGLEARLRAELATVVERTAAERASIASRSTAARGEAAESHGASLASLQEAEAKLAAALKESGEKHREAEAALRKKKEKGERDLAAKIAEYDEAMSLKHGEAHDLKALMAAEKQELDALEEHFAKVDANNAQRAEEERILGEFQRRVLDATKALDRAATRVQKIARGNLDRARVKAEHGKGGKKKKKK